METAFTIKNSMPVELSDFNFQISDGEIQSIRLETADPYDLDTAKDIKAVLDNYLEDYNLTLSPMQGRVQVRTQ